MANDVALNSLWGKNYVLGRREAEEMLTPEEKIITEEEKKFLEILTNIYDKDGVKGLTDYFFANLKFKKYEQADSILSFFKKITGQLPLKVPPWVERRLIREAQIQRNIDYNYTMCLGKTIFGQPKFTTMVRAR